MRARTSAQRFALGVALGGVFLVLPARGLAQGDGGTPPPNVDPSVSANGEFRLYRLDAEAGRCRLELRRSEAVAWTLSSCPGTKDDLLFVSNGGDRFWVLARVPEKPQGRRAGAWHGVTVATLYDQQGKVVRRKRLDELMNRVARQNVQQLQRHFKWLGGVAGTPGMPPFVNEKNQLEFETLEPKRYKLDF